LHPPSRGERGLVTLGTRGGGGACVSVGIGIYGIYSVGVGRRMRRVALMGSDID